MKSHLLQDSAEQMLCSDNSDLIASSMKLIE